MKKLALVLSFAFFVSLNSQILITELKLQLRISTHLDHPKPQRLERSYRIFTTSVNLKASSQEHQKLRLRFALQLILVS